MLLCNSLDNSVSGSNFYKHQTHRSDVAAKTGDAEYIMEKVDVTLILDILGGAKYMVMIKRTLLQVA